MKKNSFILLFVLLIIFASFSLLNGKVQISLDDYFLALKSLFTGESQAASIVLFDIRFPRIISAIIIGAALSVAGGVYQNMFINPLVSPSILGVLSGASFGAALAMILNLSLTNQMLFSFIFGFVSVAFAIFISSIGGKKNIIMLVLGGVISSSLFSSLLASLKYLADPNETLPAITYFLMGSLSFASKSTVFAVLIPMLFGIFALILLGKHIDALSLGEEEAKAMGVNVRKIRFFIIFFATLISALSVMLAGIIGWIGLIVPHIARFLYGANSQIMLLASAFIGALFLLLCDQISRSLFTYEIPIGIVSSFFGIPIFLLVLFKRIR